MQKVVFKVGTGSQIMICPIWNTILTFKFPLFFKKNKLLRPQQSMTLCLGNLGL